MCSKFERAVYELCCEVVDALADILPYNEVQLDERLEAIKVLVGKSKGFIPPSVPEVTAYAKSIGFDIDGDKFYDFYQAKGWMIGKNKMRDWQAAVRTWKPADLKVETPLEEIARKRREYAVGK